MIQPAGTKTYKGRRATGPGDKSFEKDESLLKKSGDLHSVGKAAEKKSKEKKPEVKPVDPVVADGKGDKK